MRLALIVLLTASVIGVPTARADDDTDAAIETVSSTVGEVLALGDLCEWNFAPRVDKLIQDGAKVMRLSTAQLKDVRGKIATARRQTFGRFSATGQARMRADVCKPEERVRLEAMIAKISFD
jgi:hypothetical protein